MNKPLDMGDTGTAIEVIHREIVAKRKKSLLAGVEVGVYRGATSAKLLKETPTLRMLYMIDPWATYAKDHPYRRSGDSCAKLNDGQQWQNMLTAKQATEFASDRRTIMRTDSADAALSLTGKLFDFVFIDADHTYEAVASDLRSWWPRVRSGGLLMGHDFGHPRNRRGLFGVDRAAQEFSEQNNLRLRSIGEVFWITKP